jgi:hypothetical protein
MWTGEAEFRSVEKRRAIGIEREFIKKREKTVTFVNEIMRITSATSAVEEI